MGRPVAVKVLMGDLEGDPETRARFYREAQAAAGLLHPNIITIYDAGEDKGRSYIAMQLLEGWPLSAYLKQPVAAPLERKLDLMIQMCEGLVAAHARGIVHRDLKPGNLFVQSDGLLKILDFGVARLADSSMTATGAMLGTPDYMSPEQARGNQVDARSDIFSTGAVFYYMLAGHKPFPGPDLPAVLRQLQFEAPAALTDAQAPPELARLVTQAMAKDVAERPQRAQDLLAGVVRFRRHYQAETRKMAAEAGARYTAIAQAEVELRSSAAALELPPQDDASPVLRTLRERYPALADRGASAFEAPSFDRARVHNATADLDDEQRRIEAQLAERRRHVSLLDEGERHIQGGRVRPALQLFEQVLRERPSSGRASALVARWSAAAGEEAARDDEVAGIIAAATRAFQARDLTQTIEHCQAALALAPEHPAALSLLGEAQRAAARDERRKSLLVQQTLDRARSAVDAGRFDEADAVIREAEALAPSATAIGALRDDLARARVVAQERERLRRLADEEVRRARAAFRRGRYDEAVTQLSALAAREELPEVEAEVARLDALRQRIVRSEQSRRRQVVALASAARAAAATGRLDEAVARARDAVRCDPSDLDASALLSELSDRELASRIEQERELARDARARDAEPMLAAAHEARRRGYISAALSVALSASRVAPDREDVADLIEELRRAAASSDAADDVEPVDEPFTTTPALRAASAPIDAIPAVQPRVTPQQKPQQTPAPPVREGGLLAQLNQWMVRKRPTNR
jgi:tetratricopeptide (TPR) repeat protein